MNVGELIEALSGLDPNLPISVINHYMSDYEYGELEATSVALVDAPHLARPDMVRGEPWWFDDKNVRCVEIR